jgi:uncharacterized protein YbaR (Trm112 family)
MSLTRADVSTLACPICREPLEYLGSGTEILQGALACDCCGRRWPVRDGVPQLYDDERTSGMDRLLRPIYDFVAPYHDAGADLVLPILQFPDFGATRDRYLEHLELGSLHPPRDGSPLRILEVGIGAGANVPLVQQALPSDLAVEFWGIDFSRGMLREAARRLARSRAGRVRLLLADAHALPFPDATFDRVFHVGGINGYRDIRRGLAEMARVARPQTPIVVVDEELDPKGSHWLFHRLAFGAITAFDAVARAPRELVPIGAHDVAVTRVSRFYYCLTFRAASENGRTDRVSPASIAALTGLERRTEGGQPSCPSTTS